MNVWTLFACIFVFTRLDRNNLGIEECQVVADIITHNEKLALIEWVHNACECIGELRTIYFLLSLEHSLSKNPIGNEGFSFIMDALIAKPQSSLKKLGWGDCIVLETCHKHFSCVQYIVVEHNLPCADTLYFSCKITVPFSIWCCYTCIMEALWCGHH